jgi:methylphosphotriester-DNA--protein-cysteine methyltransferase
MYTQQELGTSHYAQIKHLLSKIKTHEISVAGNKKLKIYGTFSCRSGKRMKVEHRVFFKDIQEAESLGYRPCGHCMRVSYKNWKAFKSNLIIL